MYICSIHHQVCKTLSVRVIDQNIQKLLIFAVFASYIALVLKPSFYYRQNDPIHVGYRVFYLRWHNYYVHNEIGSKCGELISPWGIPPWEITDISWPGYHTIKVFNLYLLWNVNTSEFILGPYAKHYKFTGSLQEPASLGYTYGCFGV